MKHYGKDRVRLNTLEQISSILHRSTDTKRGVLVTSNQLSSIVKKYLNDIQKDENISLNAIDGAMLKNLLQKHPDIVKKYFGEEAQK